MTEEKFDFEHFKQEAIQGLYAGKSLTGEKGIFSSLLKHFLGSALEGELSAHLLEEKAQDTPVNGETIVKCLIALEAPLICCT